MLPAPSLGVSFCLVLSLLSTMVQRLSTLLAWIWYSSEDAVLLSRVIFSFTASFSEV